MPDIIQQLLDLKEWSQNPERYERRLNFRGAGLVQPGPGRQGYADAARKETQKQWYKDKFEKRLKDYDEFQKSTNYTGTDAEYEKWKKKQKGYKKVPPTVRAQYEKVTNYLQKLIPELNAGEKYISGREISSMVEKKFNIKPRYETMTYKGVKTKSKVNRFVVKDYPVMKNLDPPEIKIENTLKKYVTGKETFEQFLVSSFTR